MILSQSNGSYLGKFSDEKVIDIMVDSGFDAMDFGFFSEKYYSEETDSESFKQHFLDLKKYAENKGVFFNQAHAPFPTGVADPIKSKMIFEDVVRSMRNASYLGIKNIVVHPIQYMVYRDEGIPEQLFEINVDFYSRLKPYYEEYGVRVLTENMWHIIKYYGGQIISDSVCSCPEEFIQYVDAFDREWFGACLDIGHTMLVHQEPDAFIRKLGSRLDALHVHDVDGINDLHTIPFFGGAVDWNKVTKALREIEYKGDFTLEVCGKYFESIPKALIPTASKLAAEAGRYVMNMI